MALKSIPSRSYFADFFLWYFKLVSLQLLQFLTKKNAKNEKQDAQVF